MTIKRFIISLACCVSLTAAGQNWQTVGGGANNNVRSIFGDTLNNVLYAVGGFTEVGGIPANYVAKWNGSTWDSLGNGFASLNFGLNCLTMYRGKIVVAAQAFSFSDFHIVTWDGFQWDSIGSNFAGSFEGGAITLNNELYAFGTFGTINSTMYNGVAKFDTISQTWVSLGFPYVMTFGDPPTIKCLAMYHGQLYAGGLFLNSAGTAAANIARYDGSTWSIVGSGITGMGDHVLDLTVYKDELYAAGLFSDASGNPGNKIARWNDTIWRDVGGGVTSGGQINTLLEYNGKLYAGGSFSEIGGIPANYIAAWDGAVWCGFGNNMYSSGVNSDRK